MKKIVLFSLFVSFVSQQDALATQNVDLYTIPNKHHINLPTVSDLGITKQGLIFDCQINKSLNDNVNYNNQILPQLSNNSNDLKTQLINNLNYMKTKLEKVLLFTVKKEPVYVLTMPVADSKFDLLLNNSKNTTC